MREKFIKNESGSILPFVALFIFFVGIGFAALLVDGGFLYKARREMVTAADAGALAGAIEMENKLGYSYTSDDIGKALLIAEKFALDNGAQTAKATFLKNEVIDGLAPRDFIKVEVEIEKTHYFAKIFNFDQTTVKAEAVATWGIVRQITGGQIWPLFMTEDAYIAQEVNLHDGKAIINDVVSNPNRDLVRLTGLQGNKDITTILSGANIDQEFVINSILITEPGGGSIENAIEQRMINSFSYTEGGITKYRDEDGRRKFMSGLLPIVNTDDTKGKLELTIEYFVVYTIYDVVMKNNPKNGSIYGFKDPDFTSDNIVETYDDTYAKATIIGKITGDKVFLNAVINDGDQTPNDNEEDKEGLATYSKLVK